MCGNKQHGHKESQDERGCTTTAKRFVISHNVDDYIFCKGPLTDLFKPLLRNIYSHVTLLFLVSSELFHAI